MKKLTLLLAAITIVVVASAQNPNTNSGFENWVQGPGFEEPAGWITFNQFSVFGGPVVIEKTTDANSGQFAMKLFNAPSLVDLSPIDIPKDTLLGLAAFNDTEGGVYTQRPWGFKVFLKHIAQQSDTALVVVGLKKAGENSFAGGAVVLPGALTSYTEFIVPIQYSSQDNPDSIEVFITTMAGFAIRDGLGPYNPTLTQELFVDDFELLATDPNSVNNPMFGKSLNVFPNPAANNLFIDAQGFDFSNTTVVEIADLTGRTIKTQEMAGKLTSVDIANLNSGIYLYRVFEGNALTKLGTFNVVK